MGKDSIRTKYYELLDEFDRYKADKEKELKAILNTLNACLKEDQSAIDKLQRIKEIVK